MRSIDMLLALLPLSEWQGVLRLPIGAEGADGDPSTSLGRTIGSCPGASFPVMVSSRHMRHLPSPREELADDLLDVRVGDAEVEERAEARQRLQHVAEALARDLEAEG